MNSMDITRDIRYVGVNDREIDLFESQYLLPEGISYNSYLILDEKIALFDTADVGKTKEWLANVKETLKGRAPDYLIISHMEPDHAGSIMALVEEYPQIKFIGNSKTFAFMAQFFDFEIEARKVVVAEGDTISLGRHTLQFIMAPMIHWPEVMVTYEQSEQVFFSADAFGRFGALDIEMDWRDEARRYYINIVGKYGAQVQALLEKAEPLPIRMICPLHGPVLKENVKEYIGKYKIWSSYEPEEQGVLIAYASIYGHTGEAAKELGRLLAEQGEEKVMLFDLARSDASEVVSNAFRFDRMVVAAATYDGGIFPCMESFLLRLKAKNYQKRKVALIENGTWGPIAGKRMRDILAELKEVQIMEPVVTIRSAMKEETKAELAELAKVVANI